MIEKRKIPYFLMIIPALILFFSFHTLPVLKGLFYSFSDYKGWGNANFVGLKNYINVFKDTRVWNSYGFTLLFAITSTILVNIVSLIISVALNGKVFAKKYLQSVFFLPNVMSLLIVGYIFKFIFAKVLPSFFSSFAPESLLSKNILGDPSTAWIGIVLVTVWQAAAINIILYSAGLQSIPEEIYEAANLDGARAFTKFKSITFPMIAPFFTINMVLCMKNFLLAFDVIISLTGGGPGRATESVSLLIYRGGFQGGEFAYQSANAIILSIIIATISILQTRYLRKREVQL